MAQAAEPKGEITCTGKLANGAGAAVTRTPGAKHAEVDVCETLHAEVNSLELTLNGFPCSDCCDLFRQRNYKLHIVVTGDQGTYSTNFRAMGLLPAVVDPATGQPAKVQVAKWTVFPVHVYFMGGQITKVSWLADADQAPARFVYARAGTARRRASLDEEQLSATLEAHRQTGFQDQAAVNKVKRDLRAATEKRQASDLSIKPEAWTLNKTR